MVLEAGRAIGAYDARDWIGDVDVPVSTVVTMRDHVVPLRRQIRLFQAIKGAEPFRVDGAHDAILSHTEFPALLVGACRSVAERAAGDGGRTSERAAGADHSVHVTDDTLLAADDAVPVADDASTVDDAAPAVPAPVDHP